MGKPSRRPTREERKYTIDGVKKTRAQLRKDRQAKGLQPPKKPTTSNCQSPYKRVDEEIKAREEAVEAQMLVYRPLILKLLKQLSKIKDLRQVKKCKHKLRVILFFGILSALFQMTSRREANRKMSRACFLETLQGLFPEFESCPHADTLNRLLSQIDPEAIASAHIDLIKQFTRKKKFRRFLVSKQYMIAIDGTQKLSREGVIWGDDWLERTHQSKQGETTRQYVYVLEANLVFSNGVSIPLMSEFLSMSKGDNEREKQDCERRAFFRLAKRIKEAFPRLAITVLLDGLYPNGPLIDWCQEYHWGFMIGLPDQSLPTVWEDYLALLKLSPKHRSTRIYKGRRQEFEWVNDLHYYYGNSQNNKVCFHVVVCYESWEELDPQSAQIIQKHSKHAWISSEPITLQNLHLRCNLMARRRWAIETSMLIEKKQGYCYEHLLSHHFNAMIGFHYIMRIAHMINTIALLSKNVAKKVKQMGVAEYFNFVRETCANRWLSPEWIKAFLQIPFRII